MTYKKKKITSALVKVGSIPHCEDKQKVLEKLCLLILETACRASLLSATVDNRRNHSLVPFTALVRIPDEV